MISNRAYPYYKNPLKTTKENLKKNKINYTELILTNTNDKSKECKDLKIDIMFDDLEMVNNFEEIYLKIKEVENNGI